MFFADKDQKLEKDVIKNNLAFQELLIRMDGINQEINTLLEELKVSPQQLEIYLSNAENFTEENWLELQKQRTLMNEKLNRDKANIRDPRKVKKSQNDRNVQQHWLFVR